MIVFQKATKKLAKLRLAVFGPAGSGKTKTALRMAAGIGGKIGLIDTERGSASKYSDQFNFDTVLLENKTLEGYMEAIRAAAAGGYDVLIIDSLTHGWRELLEHINKLARAKYGGNTWSAWNEGTPEQMRFIDALLNYPGHIIATMRSRTEWVITKTEDGKNRPERIGLQPEEGKGIEYEFDLLMEMSSDHLGRVIKDRTGKYQDLIIDKPGEEFGRELADWLSEGAAEGDMANLAFLRAQAIGWGVLKEKATAEAMRTFLALTPFTLEQAMADLDGFRAWCGIFRKHRASMQANEAALAATEEFKLLPKAVGG